MDNNELIKRMLKILDKTYLFYAADPSRRGTDGKGGCYYEAPNGNKCAIGRCMKKSEVGRHLSGDAQSLYDERDDEGRSKPLDSLLTKSHQGLPTTFWGDLQEWHDNDQRWFPNADHKVGSIDWGEADLGGIYEDYIILRVSIEEGCYCPRG